MVSGQQIDVVLAVRLPRGEIGETASVVVEAQSSGEALAESTIGVQWTYASHADNDRQPRNREVDREVAKLYAARARAEATEANRDGAFDRARHVLEATSRRIREYAGDDRELRELARALHDEVRSFAEAPMSPMALKSAFFAAARTSKGRDDYGRARRR